VCGVHYYGILSHSVKRPCSEPMSLGPWHVQQLKPNKKKKHRKPGFSPVCFLTKRHSQMHVCQMLGGRGQDTEWQLTWFLQSSRNALKFETKLGSLLGWRSIVRYNICQAFYAVDKFLPRARFMPSLIFFLIFSCELFFLICSDECKKLPIHSLC
jgi:hypothetical protein